jgi:predicted nuclease with TOPRIM domain
MLKKLLGIDKLEERLNQVEQEKHKLQAEKEALEAEKIALNEKLNEKTPKEIATENKEPWVDVLKTSFEDPNKPSSGYFELDWNSYFVSSLIEAGYSGRTDEDVVEMWFTDLCRGVTKEEPQ